MRNLIALLTVVGAVILGTIVVQATAQPPVTLAPGDSQPIVCANGATPVGTVSAPACPTVAPTATPATVPMILGAANTIYRLSCPAGQTPLSQGPSGSNLLVYCPPLPTATPTGAPPTVTPSPTP